MTQVGRLLILSCSQQKKQNSGHLPAILRYDGPLYRVYRRFQGDQPALAPDVYILSAKFGLIPGTRPIPYYEQKMTKQRADELLPIVSKQLSLLFLARTPNDVYVCAGQDYLRAMGAMNWEKNIAFATGSMGKRQAELKNWLYLGVEMSSHSRLSASVRNYKPNICGTQIKQTSDEAIQIARKALAIQKNASSSYHSWFVQIDTQKVGPKWFLSQLTGLHTNTFHTEAAVRALTGLGIEVRHI